MTTVLVVDDEMDLRDVFEDELAVQGLEVLEAANGREALELLRKTPADAVFTDMRMPGGDGFEQLNG